MTDIDRAIRDALSSEDRAFIERLEQQPPLHRQIGEMFRGRMRWLNILGWILGLVLFGIACWCGWHFVRAPEMREMLLWGAAGGLAVVGFASVKIWMWMQLHQNNLMREIKRLELLIAAMGRSNGRAA